MLTFETTMLRCAKPPQESQIPDIKSESSLPFFTLDRSVPRDHGLTIGEGMVPSALPYPMQSLYDRNFQNRPFHAAILENQYLRAVFLPELGGRLWSLYDKQRKRELVYQNKVLAYANLALRNAWFAGGVEWNIGVRGHTHFTCSPLFACREINAKGEEILKMYEYEAIRGLAYVIRAGLYEDSLRVNITVENTRREPTYLYWWSNIAIPQTAGTRVFVPTEKSYVTSYRDGGYVISCNDIPMIDGDDISYPARAKVARDYFFDIPKESNKWIAAVGEDGIGLLHSSDQALIGRKLFVWGNTAGGRHWNDWLTDGGAYAEIQAGLAKTQFEHLPMEPRKVLSWNECYRAVSVPNKDGDYRSVCEKIEQHVDRCDFGNFFAAKITSEPVICGSGRGSLATLLDPNEAPTICEFPQNTLTDRDAYFAVLLQHQPTPTDPPISYAIDPRYAELIDAKEEKSDYDRYMSGVIAVANGHIARAEQEFLAVGGKWKWLALACLAQIEVHFREDFEKGFSYVHHAFCENPNDLPLLILYGEIALKAKRYEEFLERSASSSSGRVRMYRAKCLIETNRLDEAKGILSDDLVIPDIREGEYALSAIWVDLYRRVIAQNEHRDADTIEDAEILQKYPLPYKLDFRMH